MRITRAERFMTEREENLVRLHFVQDGVPGTIIRKVPDPLPHSWREWARDRLLEHLATTTYTLPHEVLFPADMSLPETAKNDFENLPGWASWDAQEASYWIEDNVTDLASAKVALTALARAIIYLRDIVIER